MGSEFSRNALELYRKSNKPLRCKSCVEQAQRAERDAASSRAAPTSVFTGKATDGGAAEAGAETPLKCSACTEDRPPNAFNKTQLRKPGDKRRCRECVAQAEDAEKAALASSKVDKLAAAEKRVAEAGKGGNAVEKLQAAAALSALQAEAVTGLKPTKLLRVKTRR